jgi:predicted acyltransferase
MPVLNLENKPTRLQSLDILRGLAIFGMIFSSYIPTSLPRWMHHNQYWANGCLVANPGLTWVDIVYPIFLFSLGMAIPFALSKRIEEKMPMWQLIGHIFWRALVICGFAYFLGNAYGYPVDSWMWIRGLVGFVCLVLFLARLPFIPDNKKVLKAIPKIMGFAGLFILMATVVHKDGTGFTTGKRDIIILIMSQVYLTTAIVWLISRKNIPLRLAILSAFIAIRLNNAGGGEIYSTLNQWLDAAHIKWFYLGEMIFISSVAIFGSILGDILLQWSREQKDVTMDVGLSKSKLTWLLVTLPMLTVGGLYFLQTRHVYWGLLYTAVVCAITSWLIKDTQTSMGKLIKLLYKWATFLLIIGYILEPYEGGIKKDPATLSYYFLTAGMAASLLIFFFILVDGLCVNRGIGFLQIAGSNPMLAYIMGEFLITPILYLSHLMSSINKFISRGPVEGMIWAVLITMFILFVVNRFTMQKIYLRV